MDEDYLNRSKNMRTMLDDFDRAFWQPDAQQDSSYYEYSPDPQTYANYDTPRRGPSQSTPLPDFESGALPSTASDSVGSCSRHSLLWDSEGCHNTDAKMGPATVSSSAASGYMPSEYSRSSAPSRHTGLDDFEHWQLHVSSRRVSQADDNLEATDGIPAFHLPCEFRWLTGCRSTFAYDELSRCVDHMAAEHLQYKFPQRCICWWCDERFFDVETEGGGAVSRRDGRGKYAGPSDNGARVFEERMEHIQQHIMYDRYSPLERRPRPDYWMLDHLWKNRLISKDVYLSEKARSELPPCPGGGTYPAGWRPPVKGSRESAERGEAQRQAMHDLQWEERMLKRAGR